MSEKQIFEDTIDWIRERIQIYIEVKEKFKNKTTDDIMDKLIKKDEKRIEGLLSGKDIKIIIKEEEKNAT